MEVPPVWWCLPVADRDLSWSGAFGMLFCGRAKAVRASKEGWAILARRIAFDRCSD
jgi:hypothetical protein